MFIALALVVVTLATTVGNAQGVGAGTHFCSNLYHPTLNPAGKTFASQAGQMYCFGAQRNGGASAAKAMAGYVPPTSPIKNVDAANPSEDVTPNGSLAYGQSETSIAGYGNYVVSAWNDATNFFSPCPSANYKEEGTGFGVSYNGGASFTDMGGLPNLNCATYLYEGDPSVEVWQYQGHIYFYISSIYASLNLGVNSIAVTACEVVGTALNCGQPTIVANSNNCYKPDFDCSFLDKDFLAIDPARGRLYASYTEFGVTAYFNEIELAACDLTANPMAPVCSNGSSGLGMMAAAPYINVQPLGAPPFTALCENEGAYPAVDAATGDVYLSYEHNWPSVFGGGVCAIDPAAVATVRVPSACLTLPTSSCTAPFGQAAELVTSLSGAFIPGYSRFPMNDFPRIAVSDPKGTVTVVWNDGRFKPSGDILLQSYWLGSLTPVQAAPIVVDNKAGTGWQFLPALRNACWDGKLPVSWYGRANNNTAVTNYFAAFVDPTSLASPGAATKITNVGSNWLTVSSDINPNFGDYTDNYCQAGTYAGAGYGTHQLVYFNWSDGRLGDPQPFVAHITH